jgi:hypothetical protein
MSCNDQTCGTHSHDVSGCCSSNSCGCQCGCGTSCSCNSSHSSCCSEQDHAQKFLALADAAWMEVLKEKMKEHIRSNDHMIEKLAQAICQANQEKWETKMAKKKVKANFEEKLKEIFCCDSNCQLKHPSK